MSGWKIINFETAPYPIWIYYLNFALKPCQNKKCQKFVSAPSCKKDINFVAAKTNFRPFLFWQGFKAKFGPSYFVTALAAFRKFPSVPTAQPCGKSHSESRRLLKNELKSFLFTLFQSSNIVWKRSSLVCY